MTSSADEIAEKALRGENLSAYFTNKFTAVKPVHRVNVDLTQGMLRELEERAARLNVSRQTVIKTLLARALEENRPTRKKWEKDRVIGLRFLGKHIKRTRKARA